MLRPVVTLLVVLLGAAFAGASVVGLFWLTVIAFAGILLTGAVAVDVIGRRAEDDAGAAQRTAAISDITARSHSRHRHGAHGGGALGKAA